MSWLKKIFKKNEEFLDFDQGTEVFIKDSETYVGGESKIQSNVEKPITFDENTSTQTQANYTDVDINTIVHKGLKKESLYERLKKKIPSRKHEKTQSSSSDQTIAGRYDTVQMKVPQEESSMKRKIVLGLIACLALGLCGLMFLGESKVEERIVEKKFTPKSKIKSIKKSGPVVKKTKKKKRRVAKKKYVDSLKKKQDEVRQKREQQEKLAESLEELDVPKKVQVVKKQEKKVVRAKRSIRKKYYKDTNINYLMSGRFLVYNCSGKHWACISSKIISDCDSSGGSCRKVKEFQSKQTCYRAQTVSINSNRKTGC